MHKIEPCGVVVNNENLERSQASKLAAPSWARLTATDSHRQSGKAAGVVGEN